MDKNIAVAQKISSNMEDYLEAVYYLENKGGSARVSDIARKLGVKKSSVHTALKSLSGKGMLTHEKYGSASLTGEGKRLACSLQAKEDILFRFLTEYLSIDPDTAKEEACKMEHSLSRLTFFRLKTFLRKVKV